MVLWQSSKENILIWTWGLSCAYGANVKNLTQTHKLHQTSDVHEEHYNGFGLAQFTKNNNHPNGKIYLEKHEARCVCQALCVCASSLFLCVCVFAMTLTLINALSLCSWLVVGGSVMCKNNTARIIYMKKKPNIFRCNISWLIKHLMRMKIIIFGFCSPPSAVQLCTASNEYKRILKRLCIPLMMRRTEPIGS